MDLKLVFVKCEELVIEDIEQNDIEDCFYTFEEGCALVVDDDSNEEVISFDDEDELTYAGKQEYEVREGYYAHTIGWRFSQFAITLNDPNHKLVPSDFTVQWLMVGDYSYQIIELKEEVGTMEHEHSSDGRYDEVLDIEGRPGPEEDWYITDCYDPLPWLVGVVILKR